MTTNTLADIARCIREDIVAATNQAESGHPTSSLSATDLMTVLLFGGVFRYDVGNPRCPNNDRLIFSKGHASPLLYALWKAAGVLSEEEMLAYRTFGSVLEGHPTVAFPYVDAATGSLGQGLSIGVGVALSARKLDRLPYRTYVLLGDSEMAEGSQWEAVQLAVHYQLDNLIGILDVNRLGQRGETMYGHDIQAYKRRLEAFGWTAIDVDGHSLADIRKAYEQALAVEGRPAMIVAKTVKGKGVPAVENEDGYHGKALGAEALLTLRGGDESTRRRRAPATIPRPERLAPERVSSGKADPVSYSKGEMAATRDAYGTGLTRMYPTYPDIVALDAEVSNSTRAQVFAETYPERFFEMYIAEQNMVGVALGLATRGKLPFVSTFAAFMTRAFDQIRMSQYSEANITFVGSHAGVSIGQDGPSQMGLEDIAMFRGLRESVVLYPADAVATERLLEEAARHAGITYLRTTRAKTPVIYSAAEHFAVGGSKTLRGSDSDVLTVVTAGYTVHEALAAAEELNSKGTAVRVIDLYSVKPLDCDALRKAADDTEDILVVEDHYPDGGIGDAVFKALRGARVGLHHAAVTGKPRSGSPDEQLSAQGLSAHALSERITSIVG